MGRSVSFVFRFSLSTLAFVSMGASAASDPIYPGKEWMTISPKADGWNEAALQKWSDFTFSNSQITDSLILIHGGKIVHERYARGYTPQMRHMGWSTTKSIWTTIFAIAEGKNLLSRSDSVSRFFPEVKGTGWEKVTLENLADMSSGIQSFEGYQYSPFKSDIVAALYLGPELKNKGEYRLRQTRVTAAPGERFVYSSGETNLLSACMKKALGSEQYSQFPKQELFSKIGADSMMIERDESGVFVGSSYGYATPRDFARFGYLFLRNGKWGSQQIVPEAWVKRVQEPGAPFQTLRFDHQPMQAYSQGWWLNRPVPTAQLGKYIASAPADMYFAEGHEGQLIFVIPSLDLVVLRFGVDHGVHALDRNGFFRLLLAARVP